MPTRSGPAPRSSREAAGRLDPFVDEDGIILGAHFRQAFGVEPGAVDALGAEMMLRAEPRRIIERSDRQIHLVAALLELEAERRAALAAIGTPGDRRAFIPIGFVLPPDVRLLHAFERDRHRPRRPL